MVVERGHAGLLCRALLCGGADRGERRLPSLQRPHVRHGYRYLVSVGRTIFGIARSEPITLFTPVVGSCFWQRSSRPSGNKA